MFAPLAQQLPVDIELCAVQLPGRENRYREKPFAHIAPLVSALDEILYPLLDRPFAAFGYSLGALVAFEWARAIREAYRISPTHLFIAAQRAPQIPSRLAPLHDLPEELFIAKVQERYNGIPKMILNDPELLNLFIPTLRADFSILDTYQYRTQAPLDCGITAFGGSSDPVVMEEDLDGWRDQTAKQFTRHIFAGGHFFITGQQRLVAQAMLAQLPFNKP
jgi:medium-chain acyl-[acyl-carrier-protein] hydrolase